MITIDNYFYEIGRVGIANLPDALRKSHDFLVKSTDSGRDWSIYLNNESIRKVIDLYLHKLNQFLSANKEIHSEKNTTKENATSKRKRRPLKKKANTNKRKEPVGKKVTHIREEIKFIKRYVGLHNKVKSPKAVLAFIKALQKSIVQKLMRKASPLSKEIQFIQDKLVTAYNSMKGDTRFELENLPKYVAIAGGERVFPSINIMKRFISMQGKEITSDKLSAFTKHIEKALSKQEVTESDPYADKVQDILKEIRKMKAGHKVEIAKAELNGLQGIVKACGCRDRLGHVYRLKERVADKRLKKCRRKFSYSNSRGRGTCSHNQGLNGVLTAQQMAERKLDVLEFFSVWLELFGKPARNFTMMFHGEPHNGKTIFLLKFAQFLAENFGKVLYVSSEEFASTTMTSKVKQFLNPLPQRLDFAENLKDPKLSEYDFVIMDSVNDLGLRIIDYKAIRNEHPNTAFIFILQHTKAGDFRGGKDWEHLAEVVGEVNKGLVNTTKNRYASKKSLDFFKHFDIQWRVDLT